MLNPKRCSDCGREISEQPELYKTDASENETSRTVLGLLKLVHRRYLAALRSPDEDEVSLYLSATKLVECEDLAVHLSNVLREQTHDILKIVMDGIDYAFEDAPAGLSFLTCVVIKFAFNLPKDLLGKILDNIQDRKRKIINRGEDPSGWSYYSTFVDTLSEEAKAKTANTASLDMKDLCIRSHVYAEDYSAYLTNVAKSKEQSIAQRSMGKEGERLAHKFFSSFSDMDVTWVNDGKEMGQPYDLRLNAQGDRPLYMDVKATAVKDKEWFFISKQEYIFAVEVGKAYVIAHIRVSDDDSIRLTTFIDPVKLMKLRQMKLALHPESDMVDKENWRSFKRMDELLKIEHEVRKWWDESHVFEAEANDEAAKDGEKLFCTFSVPYMNDHLHLGHAYTISQADFAAFFHRLRGANVLLPFGFRCTGIKASVDKLKREIEQFGNPPSFPSIESDSKPELELADDVNTSRKIYKGKTSKILSKSGPETYQWQIMRDFGLSDAVISTFQDPVTWLKFFPPLAIEDLKAFGLGADWRRSFITTDINPFYNSFVRWQMNKLKESGKIVKDRAYIIYSPLDGQPCADHDRASGEGVTKAEYIIIKMEVVQPFTAKFESLSGKKIYLGAAIRRETMHCQTNVVVLPSGIYGAFEINESEVFVLTKRTARNLAYQGFSRVFEKPTCLMEFAGHDLIGLPLRSPITSNEIVCSSKDSVLISKGTGIELACSYPDETKTLIRSCEMLEHGQAVVYFEPEKKVTSRSGDECVVALAHQWCITYREPSWKKKAKDCLKKMNIYSEKTTYGESKDAEANTKSNSDFENALDRIENCSICFGLGTRIPWDEEFLVESLSDSTIYMAYYTVSHLLQNGEIYGEDTKSVKPEQLTDDVWDYIFLEGPEPKSSNIPSSLLKKMRKEFEYWYPFDVCFSGRDLIQNHLTFCIYNHTAIFPERHWPREFRCNGKIMLNSKKMSNENFKTLKEAIEEFSADATRFSLADACDGNFVSETAKEAILWLTNEKQWIKKILADNPSEYRVSLRPYTFADRVFANKINYAIRTTEKNYHEYKFREALRTGFHELQAARKEYILLCGMGGMNRELLSRYVDIQTRLIVPICPHYAEYVWRKLLKKEGFIIKAGWPEAENHDLILEESYKYVKSSISNFRNLIKKASTKSKPTAARIYVKEEYDGWKKECLSILFEKFNQENGTFAPVDAILKALKQSLVKLKQSDYMPFIKLKLYQASKLGAAALAQKLPYSEIDVLKENLEFIKSRLGLEHVEILSVADLDADTKATSHASPGSPILLLG